MALERADIPPGISEATLTAIADQLNLNLDLLMALMSKVPASLKPKTPVEFELYRLIRRLPADRQRSLLESLKIEASTQSAEDSTDYDQR